MPDRVDQQACEARACDVARQFKPLTDIVSANPWRVLRQFTSARIALWRAGGSLPTAPMPA